VIEYGRGFVYQIRLRGYLVGFGAGVSDEVVFFFQAEDGIRDRNVTGVQTCALPIWARGRVRAPGERPGRDRRQREHRARDRRGRSEERRVGKECRSRWWPCH